MNTQITITETKISNNLGELTFNIAVFNSYKIKDQLKSLGFTYGTSYRISCWQKDYAKKLIRDKVYALVEEANNTEIERERTFPTLQEA
jgi:hypothetical protein